MPKKEWESDLLDVSADSSTAGDPGDQDGDEPTSGPAADNQHGKGGDDGHGDRGINEVRGEFERKFRGLEGRFDQIMARLDSIGTAAPAQAAPSSGGGQKRIEDLSIPELQDLYGRAENPQQQAYLLDIISTKRAREITQATLSDYDRQQTARSRRQQSMKVAFDRFPELRDKTSTFHQEVMTEMELLGDAANEPAALLNVANEVAFRIGMSPVQRRQTQQPQGGGSRVSSGRSGAPSTKPNDKQLEVPEETFEEVSGRLKHAFPNGISEEAKKRILKRGRAYNEYRDDPNNPFVGG